MRKTKIKICGITEPKALDAAVKAGAHYIGFVFYPPSPRYIHPQQAAHLIRLLPSTVKAVGLFVDPTDEELTFAMGAAPIDVIQLHGHESAARVQEIKNTTHMPLIKAFPVREKADIDIAHDYEDSADWLLFDAKPVNADLPGGTGQSFDWSLLEGTTFNQPWMLSGGLGIENVTSAIQQLTPSAVDVSSGVEASRGVKDPDKITAFIDAVKRN